MSDNKPMVGVVMGSDSDWPLVQKGCATLESFGVPYETRVISAHRTPEEAIAYSKGAEARGIKVIIACAGGAAHKTQLADFPGGLMVKNLPANAGDMGLIPAKRVCCNH